MAEKKSEELEAEKTVTIEKVGIERFLQIRPQKRGICAILRTKYMGYVKTMQEWDELLTSTLNRKTT